MSPNARLLWRPPTSPLCFSGHQHVPKRPACAGACTGCGFACAPAAVCSLVGGHSRRCHATKITDVQAGGQDLLVPFSLPKQTVTLCCCLRCGHSALLYTSGALAALPWLGHGLQSFGLCHTHRRQPIGQGGLRPCSRAELLQRERSKFPSSLGEGPSKLCPPRWAGLPPRGHRGLASEASALAAPPLSPSPDLRWVPSGALHARPVRGAALPARQQDCLRGRPALPRHLPAVERGPRHGRGSLQGVPQPERPAGGDGAAGECGQRCPSHGQAPRSFLWCRAAEPAGTAVGKSEL